MSRDDAMSLIEQMNIKIEMMDQKFEFGMPPAMLQRLERMAGVKASKQELLELGNSKADLTRVESLEEKMNHLDELIKSNKRLKSPGSSKKKKSPTDPGSPDSIRKGENGEEEEEEGEGEDDDDDDDEGMNKQQMEEMKKKIDDQDKKFQQLLEQMQQRLNDEIDENRKMIVAQGEIVTRMDKEFEMVKANADGGDEGGGGGGKMSAAQKIFNAEIEEKMAEVLAEQTRLRRIDHRLNTELV